MLWLPYITLFLTSVISQSTSNFDGPKICDSPIYCKGPILKAIQLNKINADGKTFVDMATSKPLDEVMENFKNLGDNPTKIQLEQFLKQNFLEAGAELVKVNMTDFKNNPEFLKNIKDPIFKSFASKLHGFWSELVRKIDLSKLCKGCVSSYLPTTHNFVVPGGRFREFYYWDTYFAMKGLLLGELYDTSKGIILNFLEFVDRYGFMPNGARIYFLNRSQPPLLIPMVSDYIEKTKDMELLKRAIGTLDKEHEYWETKHSVEVPCFNKQKNGCKLTRYFVNNTEPRPESYWEDYTTVEKTNLSQQQKDDLYADLATGAESGWDYSTRWLKDYTPNKNETNEEILRHLETRQVIPVDLNSIMYLNEITLAKLHRKLANESKGKCKTPEGKEHIKKAKRYEQLAYRRAEIMYHLMWDPETFSFYDYSLSTHKIKKIFAASNYWPFWTGALTEKFKKQDLNYLKSLSKIEELSNRFIGGIPSSLTNSTLQWDFPNSWPPLEYVLVEALENSSQHFAQNNQPASNQFHQLGQKLSLTFIKNAICGWYRTGGALPGLVEKYEGAPKNDDGHMFEKFDVLQIGKSGGGGEYTVQTGFGWTNGVTLALLNQYGNSLKAPDLTKECGL